jgi:hypothetical protein
MIVAYTGPERRQADRLHKLSDEYRRAYAFTSRVSVNWSPESLRVRLRVLMSALPYYEESWGEVDALADLLGKHQPPWGRSEL